jgi:hypothetical protein
VGTPRTSRWVIAALAAALGAGCQREERIINYKPFLSGLEGAKSQTPAVQERPAARQAASEEGDSADSLVRKNPDGTTTLLSRSGLHLMHHIRTQLAGDNAQLFADQVLCTVTREEYVARGLDPREAFKTLKPDLPEISKLFARMPLGEHSPNVNIETVGRNIFRVQLRGRAADGLKFTGFDMMLEKGHWRLRWFVR